MFVTTSLTLTTSLNPAGMNTETQNCQHAFTTTISLPGEGFNCDLAAVDALRKLKRSVADAGEQCQQVSPECGAASVDVIYSKGDSPINIEKDESLLWCKVTVTAKITVRCGEGETKIDSPAVSGVRTADIECRQPESCPTEPEVLESSYFPF